jgi:hypothetical protein
LISITLDNIINSVDIFHIGLEHISDQKDQERTILVTATALVRLELLTESFNSSSDTSLKNLGKSISFATSYLFILNTITTLNKSTVDSVHSYLIKQKQSYNQDSQVIVLIDILLDVCEAYKSLLNSTPYKKILLLNSKIVNATPDLITLAIGSYSITKFYFEKKPEHILNAAASLLIFLKEYQHLPSKLDSLLSSNFSLLYSYCNYVSLSKNYHSKDWSFNKINSSLYHIINLLENLSRCFKQGGKFAEYLNKYIGKQLDKTESFKRLDKHIFWETRDDLNSKWNEIKKIPDFCLDFKSLTNFYFTTNMSSNFVDTTFLSPELTEKTKASDINLLLERAEKLITPPDNKTAPNYNVNGWKTLKIALLEKKIPDYSIEEIDIFISCLKAIFISTLDNEELSVQEKVKKVQELAKIGDSCPEGWLNDFMFSLDNRSNDYKWVIQDFLSIKRSILSLESIANSLPNWISALFGSSNNTHLVSFLSVLMSPVSPTKISQLNKMLSPPNFFDSFLNSMITHSWDFRNPSVSKIFTYLGSVSPLLLFGLNKYSPQFIIDSVYEANSPLFVLKEGCYIDERVFSKEAFLDCLNELNTLGIEYLDENTGELDKDLVEQVKVGDKETLCFSKKGIILILWKMGIIECTASSKCTPAFREKELEGNSDN